MTFWDSLASLRGWDVLNGPPVFFSSLPHWVEGFSSGSHFPLQRFPRSAELASKEGGNCNNVTFGAKSSWSRSHVTTTNHDFTLSGLTCYVITTNHDFTSSNSTFITALGSFSSTPLSKRRSIPPHLCHRINGTSTYKIEEYSVGRVSDMI